MSRTSTLILLGVLTILVPFSGLPMGFRTLLIVVFGAGVASIGLLIRIEETQALSSPEALASSSSPQSEEERSADSETHPVGVSPI